MAAPEIRTDLGYILGKVLAFGCGLCILAILFMYALGEISPDWSNIIPMILMAILGIVVSAGAG